MGITVVENDEGKLRWGTEQRLEFIDFKVFWEGGVQRSDIKKRFGVSVPQASSDLSLYQRLAPNNLRYDASEKRYVPTPDFRPEFMRPNPDRYLIQLKAIAEGIIELGDTWITYPPVIDSMPVPGRRIEPAILKQFFGAIKSQRSIEILFHSMNPARPDAIWRRISPHAFATDGLRWHVRAFCHIDNKFKDFILSRCQSLRGEDTSAASPQQDHQWNNRFEVQMVPNPDLSTSQQETIAMDYGMERGRANITMRCALLYYFEKRLRLDVEAKNDKPAERPVVIANYKEFKKARDAAMA